MCDFEFAKYNNVIVYQQCLNSLAKHEQLYRELPVFFCRGHGSKVFLINNMMMIQSYRYFYPGPYTFSPINQNIIHHHHHSFIQYYIPPLRTGFFFSHYHHHHHHPYTDRPNERTNDWYFRSINRSVYIVWMNVLAVLLLMAVLMIVLLVLTTTPIILYTVLKERERKKDIGQNVANGGLEYKCFLCTWHTDN